jgi:prepilin-type N-terminal cleavage/methylation domain-containing protein
MRSTRSGFTLIETMAVLTIAGTAMTMAFPEVVRAVSHARVNQAAAVAAGDFELAASLADRQRRPVRVTIDPVARTMTFTDRNSGTVLAQRPFGSTTDFKLERLISAPAQVDLFPNGTASQATVVTLALAGYARHITISRAGQVRVTP